MLGSTDASTFRRRVVGISLIAFPLLLVVDAVLDVGNEGTPESLFEEGAERPGAAVAAAIVVILSSVFVIPAVVGVMQLLRERGVVLGHLGAFFAVLGALGHVGFATLLLFLPAIGDGPRDEMVALLDRVDGGAGIVLFPLILSFGVGVLLLMIGLWHGGLAPLWALVAMVVAVAFEVVAPGDFQLGQIAKQTLTLAAYGWIGLHILRMPDAGWGQPHRHAVPTTGRAQAPA